MLRFYAQLVLVVSVFGSVATRLRFSLLIFWMAQVEFVPQKLHDVSDLALKINLVLDLFSIDLLEMLRLVRLIV